MESLTFRHTTQRPLRGTVPSAITSAKGAAVLRAAGPAPRSAMRW